MTADPATAPTAELVTESDGILTIAISSDAPGNPLNDDALSAGAAALREIAAHA